MKLFDWAETKFKTFTVWDIAIFKIALISIGMLIGAYSATFVKGYAVYFIGLFLISYVYLIYKMLK